MTNQQLAPHGHLHDHTHRARTADDLAGLRLAVAYDRLTSALQVVSAQFILLTADRSLRADPREAGDARGLLLAEARSALAKLVPGGPDRGLHATLVGCLADLEDLAASLRTAGGPVAGGRGREAFVRRLRDVASRLARCADHEQGLQFFGSGGCADSEHRYLHI